MDHHNWVRMVVLALVVCVMVYLVLWSNRLTRLEAEEANRLFSSLTFYRVRKFVRQVSNGDVVSAELFVWRKQGDNKRFVSRYAVVDGVRVNVKNYAALLTETPRVISPSKNSQLFAISDWFLFHPMFRED